MKSRAAGVSYLRSVPSAPYTERRQTSAPAGRLQPVSRMPARVRPAGLIDYSQLTDPFAATLGAAVDAANTDVTGTADVGGGKTASQDTTIGGTDYAAIGALINSIGRLGVSVAQTVMTQMNAQQALDMQRAALAAAAQLRSQGQTMSASQADTIAALAGQRAGSGSGISTTTLALGAVVILGAVYLMTRPRVRANPSRRRRRSRRSY